jgi:hypothetical protein
MTNSSSMAICVPAAFPAVTFSDSPATLVLLSVAARCRQPVVVVVVEPPPVVPPPVLPPLVPPPLVLPPLVLPPLVLPPDVLGVPVVENVPVVLPLVLVPVVLVPLVPVVLVLPLVDETPPLLPPLGFGAGRSFGTDPADASDGAPDESFGTSTLSAFGGEGVPSSPPLVALPMP